ncbi:hypothetical protein T4B_15217 [Trichinella pseudospiralis]|uniref:Uncharacterized protein n=2 Tax=Trichinella pseudospiralis TaxID=6337 RepID=A0A0V1JB31_TRIPS|nr:hypothetical protein T4B_15217 [Trichinella pseudospiralis]
MFIFEIGFGHMLTTLFIRGHKSVVAPSTNLEATRVISISVHVDSCSKDAHGFYKRVGPGSEYDVQQLGLEISAPSSNSAETASHCRANDTANTVTAIFLYNEVAFVTPGDISNRCYHWSDQRIMIPFVQTSNDSYISNLNVNMGNFLHGEHHVQLGLNIRVIDSCQKAAWNITEREHWLAGKKV